MAKDNGRTFGGARWAAKDRATGTAAGVAGRNTLDNKRPAEGIEGNQETTQAPD